MKDCQTVILVYSRLSWHLIKNWRRIVMKTAMKMLCMVVLIPGCLLLIPGNEQRGEVNAMERSERYLRGLEQLKQIDGEAGEHVLDALNSVSPDLARYILEYSFGDVYSRKGLDLKSREIAVVAALTAMGNARPQLKVHLNGALNVGCTVNEVKEVILQMAGYSGFPSCINAMTALKEVMDERLKQGKKDPTGREYRHTGREEDRYAVGARQLSSLDNTQVRRLEKTFNDFSPDLVKYIIEFGYADLYARDNLDKRYRQIATIAALTAMGTATEQLRFHINAGLNIGLTPVEIKEIMLLMTVYAGFPSAINGTLVLKEIVKEREKVKPGTSGLRKKR